MGTIAEKPRIGHDIKIRIDNKRFSNFLTGYAPSVSFDTEQVNPLGVLDALFVQTGKTHRMTLTGYQWRDEQDLDDVIDDWRTHNHNHFIQVYPTGETMPARVQTFNIVAEGADETSPRDSVQGLVLEGVQSGDVERFTFESSNSDFSDHDWLWTLANSHLELVTHRNTISEPHLGATAITGLDADKKVAVHFTLKAITGFGTPFMTENDSRFQIGWYDRAEPAGQTFFEPITEYRHIANGNNFQELVIADPPTRLANNDLAVKFDLAPINTPDHQTYAFDIRKSFSAAVID